eukprot:244175-Hanusia_phi.AAC.2
MSSTGGLSQGSLSSAPSMGRFPSSARFPPRAMFLSSCDLGPARGSLAAYSPLSTSTTCPPASHRLNAATHDTKVPANKSRYQFPVEALIDGAKQGEAKQDDVAKEIEEIESSLKAELAANPSNITNIMELFHFMRLVLEDEEAVSK